MTTLEIINGIKQSKGDEKRKLLLELCEHRTAEADEFFSEKLSISNKNMMPYYCYSRCDAVSDFAAELLDGVVDKLIAADCQYSTALSGEAFITLALSAFKQSEKLVGVLRKIGENYPKIKSMTIAFLEPDYIPFFRRLANKAYAHCCESNFIRLLNDLLILTTVRSGFEFADTVKRLYADYPQVYGCAAFFAYFTEDNSAAFGRFGKPENITEILNTMNGTQYSADDNCFRQWLPYWFYSTALKIWGGSVTLSKPLDIRWIKLLCNEFTPEQLGRHYGVDHARGICRKFDGMMINLIVPGDAENNALLKEHFVKSAASGGAVVSFKALETLGFTDYEKLVGDICVNICASKSNYYALYNAFAVMKLGKTEKLSLLDKAEKFLLANDNREKFKNQRAEFSKEILLYKNGKKGRFNSKITL